MLRSHTRRKSIQDERTKPISRRNMASKSGLRITTIAVGVLLPTSARQDGLVSGCSVWPSIFWVFAIIGCMKPSRNQFFSPYLAPRPLWVGFEMLITVIEVTVYRCLALLDRLVIAVVDDRFSHPAKDGLNHIQELSA